MLRMLNFNEMLRLTARFLFYVFREFFTCLEMQQNEGFGSALVEWVSPSSYWVDEEKHALNVSVFSQLKYLPPSIPRGTCHLNYKGK